ncbi:MAG TPA: two-component system response regulator [Bacteroidales bacterium]|nr:two-component system response regulator [Bacteroidales bacterium]
MDRKILVIDDEITIRTLLDKFLSNQFDVTAMGNGQEALNWLQSGNIPDLIIVDLEMPSMDGFEFLSQVKASGYFRSIPVMMLSGVDSSAERVKCLKAGALDFMIKPFNPEELILKIGILMSYRIN